MGEFLFVWMKETVLGVLLPMLTIKEPLQSNVLLTKPPRMQ